MSNPWPTVQFLASTSSSLLSSNLRFKFLTLQTISVLAPLQPGKEVSSFKIAEADKNSYYRDQNSLGTSYFGPFQSYFYLSLLFRNRSFLISRWDEYLKAVSLWNSSPKMRILKYLDSAISIIFSISSQLFIDLQSTIYHSFVIPNKLYKA